MKNDNIVFIPLGTRCSTATVLHIHFGKRLFSLPLDWVDLPIKNINQFVSVQQGQEDEFLTDYFKNVRLNTQRHTDGTWFPHDLHKLEYPNEESIKKHMLVKYIRRLKRFNEVLLNRDSEFVFLTLCVFPGTYGSLSDFNSLKDLIINKTGKPCTFVTINLADYDFIDGNHYNFSVILENRPNLSGEDFYNWEVNIAKKINENEFLSKIFNC